MTYVFSYGSNAYQNNQINNLQIEEAARSVDDPDEI
jgi:hypothetical protein